MLWCWFLEKVMMSFFKELFLKCLGFVIDLDICVGCYGCVVVCKEWNIGGIVVFLLDVYFYGEDFLGVWFNWIYGYEVVDGDGGNWIVYFFKFCFYCENVLCVMVCLMGVFYKC